MSKPNYDYDEFKENVKDLTLRIGKEILDSKYDAFTVITTLAMTSILISKELNISADELKEMIKTQIDSLWRSMPI